MRALAAGATHLETDVQASADGVAVLSHDADLARLTGRTVRVDQLTAAELRRVDLGEGQGFATLAEALDALPEACFNLDIKADAAVGPTVQAVRAANAVDRVLVTSFSERRRRAAVELLPDVASSASSARLVRAVAARATRWPRLVRRSLHGLRAVQVPERYRGWRLVTPGFVRALHAAGIEVHVWTINDPERMVRLLDVGVDGVVTDRCDLAREVVDARV